MSWNDTCFLRYDWSTLPLAKGLTFTGIGTLLTLVALGASFISARREMRVDPIVALRHE
jgi:ABC-type lipoprotein release transport system permease subunit